MSSALPLDAVVGDALGLTELLDRAQERLHDEPREAERLSSLALRGADEIGYADIGARACYLLARLNVVRGELLSALQLIDEARTRWLAAGDRVSALRTDLGLMQVLDDLGRHTDAAAVGTSLLAALDDVGQRDADVAWLRAAALENYGVACSYIGEHELAIEKYEQAETTYAALGRADERARPMANRAIELLGLGRAREALEVFAAAAEMFEQSGDRLWAAKCRGDLARAHRHLGQYSDALRVLAQARSTLEELGATAELARLQLALATTYLEIGVYDAAAAEAAAASELTRAAGMLHDNASAQFALALAQFGSGAHARASVTLAEAGRLFEQVGDPHGRVEVRLIEAELAAATGHPDQAAAAGSLAVEESRSGGWPTLLARSLLCKADASDPGTAAPSLAEARAVIEQLALPALSYELDLRRARHEVAAGRTNDGEALLRRAIDRVEALGGTLPDHMLRRAFRARTGTAHDELVGLLVARSAPGDHEEALRIAESSKSQALRESLCGDVRAQSMRRTDSVSYMSALQVDLNATYLAMEDATDGAQRRRLHERATDLQQRIAAVRLHKVAIEPGTIPLPPAPLSADNSVLGATVAFHIAGGDVIAFVTGDDGLEVRRTCSLRAVDEQLALLSAQWNRFQVGGGFARRHEATLLATAVDVLGRLYELLIAPVADVLNEVVGDGLVVVPHRQLCNVPFQALYDGGRPLIDRWAVSVAPTRVPLPGGSAPPALSDAIVLAVPDDRAPAVGDEARAVAAALPHARVLVGAAATSDALMTLAPAGGILHIACHGLFRSSNPLFSALRLADRWVTAAELAELDLSDTLVVLSACESGRQDDAAEPVGLAWALLAAGASGVVVSRWVVDDDGAASVMRDMYRQLSVGLTPASALREAQLAAEIRTPHPFHWAPFSYVTTTRRTQ
jgi:CHAT domain-containing protein/tetratricopeptide (TPR) repeat protein